MKHGLFCQNRINYCIDCLSNGIKTIISPLARRCINCYAKKIDNRGSKNGMYGKAGKNNPSYIDGRTLIQHYCIECGNKISYPTWSYGNKRCRSCSRGGTGIPHENDEYGAEFDNALKEQIRFRDGYECQLCDCSQLENGRQLDVHHIDYDKDNNDPNNLISLCRRDNSRVNFNRSYWKQWFRKKVRK